MIQPIPTTYAGITFRSRLEADYAATFTRAELPWQYEPEGFQLSDKTWYSPDFYLPTARAWVEVKGDHNERINKVEQFAAELWQAAGDIPYQWQAAPMVIFATAPRNYSLESKIGLGRDIWHPILVGVRGPGKGYSIAITRCTECRQTTIIALWGNVCRSCGWIYYEEEDSPFALPVYEYWNMPFARLPRPAGRSS